MKPAGVPALVLIWPFWPALRCRKRCSRGRCSGIFICLPQQSAEGIGPNCPIRFWHLGKDEFHRLDGQMPQFGSEMRYSVIQVTLRLQLPSNLDHRSWIRGQHELDHSGKQVGKRFPRECGPKIWCPHIQHIVGNKETWVEIEEEGLGRLPFFMPHPEAWLGRALRQIDARIESVDQILAFFLHEV